MNERDFDIVTVLATHPVDPADDDGVEAVIDRWYESGSTLAVHEFLGWSQQRYADWAAARPSPGEVVVIDSGDAARWSPPCR